MNSASLVGLRAFIARIGIAGAMLAVVSCLTGCGLLSGSLDFFGSKSVAGISVKSLTPNGVYRTGQTIQFEVSFPSAVEVTGSPTLELSTGRVVAEANYVSGSGTNKLIFEYTIVSGDDIPVLDYRSTSSLKTQTGTIKPLSDSALELTLQPPGTAGSISSSNAIVVDTVAPTAVSNLVDGTNIAGLTAIPTTTWDPATDVSSITYQIGIGTTAGATDILAWTTKTALNTATHTGLTLTAGTTYYTSVRAVDAAGNIGAATSGDGWIPFVTLTIAPPTLDLVMNERWPFSASGGLGSLSYSLVSGPGTLTSGNVFQAPNGAGTSVVKVQDATMHEASSTVTSRAFEYVSALTKNGGPEMQITDMAYDASGTLYVTGYYNMNTRTTWLVAKYDGTTWTVLEDTMLGAFYGAAANAILVNSPTDIYVAGVKKSGSANQWTVRHFDGTTWTQSDLYNLTAGLAASATDIVRGTDGSIFVIGSALESLSVERWIVRRYSASTWATSDSYRMGGTSTRSTPSTAAVAPNGTVYVCGSAYTGASFYTDWVVRKFNGTSWSDAEVFGNSAVNESCKAIAVDSSNNVYTAGAGTAQTNELRKWNGTSWASVGSYTPSGYNFLLVSGIVLDVLEKPVLLYTGYQPGFILTSLAARFDPTPTLLHNLGGYEEASLIARQPSGDLVFGGRRVSGIGGKLWNFRKTDGTTLSSLSDYRIEKPTSFVVNDAAYDSAGNLYTVGYIETQPTTGLRLWMVRKFDGTTWTDVDTYSANAANDTSEAKEILIDSSNNIYVVGYATETSGAQHWIVRKFNGTSWTTSDDFYSASNAAYAAHAIASNSGSIYVLGSYIDSGGDVLFCIRKFDGTSWSTFQTVTITSGAQSMLRMDLLIDSSNNFWVGTVVLADTWVNQYIEIHKYDGTTWTTSDSNMTGVEVYSLHLAQVRVTGDILQSFTFYDGSFVSGRLRYFNGTSWGDLEVLGVATSHATMKSDASGNVYFGGMGGSAPFIKKLNGYNFDYVYTPPVQTGYGNSEPTAFAFGPSGQMSFFTSMTPGGASYNDSGHYRLAP